MPPMARLRLLTRHDASTACVTVLTHHFLWATQRVRRLGSLVRRACRCVERKRVTQTAASREPAIVSEALLRATKCNRFLNARCSTYTTTPHFLSLKAQKCDPTCTSPATGRSVAFMSLSNCRPETAARSAAKPPYIGENWGSVLIAMLTFPRR